LVTGVCQADYSGYPDCRAPFIASAEASLRLAMDFPFTVHTPLMDLNKAGIWKMAADLGCLDVVIHESHTCYNGDHSTLNAWYTLLMTASSAPCTSPKSSTTMA
jgi:7-cyano-7-deazaguanine synthase